MKHSVFPCRLSSGYTSRAAPASSAPTFVSACLRRQRGALRGHFFSSSRSNVVLLLESNRFELMRHDATFPLYVKVDEVYNRLPEISNTLLATTICCPNPAMCVAIDRARPALNFDQKQAGRREGEQVDFVDTPLVVHEFEVRPCRPRLVIWQVLAEELESLAFPLVCGGAYNCPTRRLHASLKSKLDGAGRTTTFVAGGQGSGLQYAER